MTGWWQGAASIHPAIYRAMHPDATAGLGRFLTVEISTLHNS